jgi:hypothetical protein
VVRPTAVVKWLKEQTKQKNRQERRKKKTNNERAENLKDERVHKPTNTIKETLDDKQTP